MAGARGQTAFLRGRLFQDRSCSPPEETALLDLALLPALAPSCHLGTLGGLTGGLSETQGSVASPGFFFGDRTQGQEGSLRQGRGSQGKQSAEAEKRQGSRLRPRQARAPLPPRCPPWSQRGALGPVTVKLEATPKLPRPAVEPEWWRQDAGRPDVPRAYWRAEAGAALGPPEEE